MKKTASSRLAKFIRTSAGSQLAKYTEDILGSATPTYMQSLTGRKIIKDLRLNQNLSRGGREDLVKHLRWRLKAPFREVDAWDDVTKSIVQESVPRINPRASRNLEFARSFSKNKQGEPIRLVHGGTLPELQQLLKRGPASGLDHPVPLPSGRLTSAGAYFHEAPHPRTHAYANRAASRGGAPAKLELDFPRDLLGVPNTTGGGAEHGIPPELWKFISNAKITKLGSVVSPQIPRGSIKVANAVKPGLLRSLLTGRGAESIPQAKRIVLPTGAVDYQAIEKGLPPPTTLTDKAKKSLKHFTLGTRPFDVTHQRMRQGGLFGEGGLMRAPLALGADVTRARQQGGWAHALAKHPLQTTSDVATTGVLTAIPALGVYKSFKESDPGVLLDTAKDYGSWALASPFGWAIKPLVYKGLSSAGEMGSNFLQNRLSQTRGMGSPFRINFPEDLYKA